MLDLPLRADRADSRPVVLCVDDDAAILQLLDRITRQAGCLPITADNGWDAVCLALQYYPDVLLLDILLPDIDGYEVMKAVARLSAVSAPPAILITGRLNDNHERRCEFAGAAGFIAKPFTAEQVIAAIEGVVGKTALHS